MDIMRELEDLKEEIIAAGSARDRVSCTKHIDRIMEHMRRANQIQIPDCFRIKRESIE